MAFDFGNLKVDREQIKTSSKTGGFNFGSLEERQNSVLSDRERIRAKMEQDKIDEQQRIAEQQRFDTQNQAIEAQGGFINGIKSFFGKGKALPTIENELPQYTQARIETQPKTFGQNVKNLLTENTANSIYDIFYQQGVDEQSAKTIESNINAIRQLVEKNKLEQDESVRTKRLKTIGLIQKSTEEIAGEAGGDIAKKTTAQLVGQSLGTALELTPFLGFKSAGTQAIKLGTKELTKQGLSQIGKGTGKQLTKDIITESALFGGATGFGEGLKQKDATAGDVFKSTAEGALAGGALAGGIVGLGKLGGKVTQKLTPRKLEFGELVPIKNKIEAQTGELKPSQILEVKTAIEKGHSEDEIVKAFQETGELTPKIDVPEPPIRTTKPVEPVKVEKPIHTPKESPLHLEAKKYSTPEEFVKAQTSQDYRSVHQLGLSDSITADSINIPALKEQIRTRNGYLNNYNLSDLKKLEKLQKNPETDVTIYRSSPKNELNDGDWVTTDKTYANDIKKQNGGKVYSYTVKVKDLRFPKDTETLPSLSMASTFSYSPKTSQLTDIWKQAHETTHKVEVPKIETKVGKKETTEITKTKKSNFAERLNKELPEEYKINEEYEVARMKDEAIKASELIKKDKQKALRIATGIEKSDDLTQTATSIELGEIAKRDRDWSLVNELFNSRRLAGTRRGQEIAMEKMSVLLNPEEKFMKDVINARLGKIKLSAGDLKKASEKIVEKSKKITEDIKKATRSTIKISKAQELLDSLICK